MRPKGYLRSGHVGLLLLFLACFTAFSSGVSYAMTLPSGIEYLGRIKMDKSVLRGVDNLTVVADPPLYVIGSSTQYVKQGATLFVVDALKHRIVVFDGRGKYLGEIPFKQVSAIGAAPDGTLYIGSHKDYSVAILRNGEVTGYLGAGEKEFSSIRNIAVNRETAEVFVVDNIGNAVRIYDASGKRLGTITGLNLPSGIALRGSETYVIDAPMVIDAMGSESTGTRVSVFDGSGKLLRSFGETRENGEGIVRPSGIAVDDKGRVYISDTLQNATFVYDSAGKLVGSIKGKDEINGAVSLTLSHEGILYLSSGRDQAIHMFSLTDLRVPDQQAAEGAPSGGKSKDKGSSPAGSSAPDQGRASSSGSASGGSGLTVSRIVVTTDSGSYNAVKIFGSDGAAESSFVPFDAYSGGLDSAVADVDGDGITDIIVGTMAGSSRVGLFSASGIMIKDFPAFNNSAGVLVGAADFDGNSRAEIIVAENGGSRVKVFGYTGSAAVDTGIDFFACPEAGAAARVAAGDIDGDGVPELVTAASSAGETIVRTWKVKVQAGIGQWRAVQNSETRLPDETNVITDMAVSGGKIMLARSSGGITIIDRDGGRADTHLAAAGITGLAVLGRSGALAAGLADGTVSIFAPDGTESGFPAFAASVGVRISSDELGY